MVVARKEPHSLNETRVMRQKSLTQWEGSTLLHSVGFPVLPYYCNTNMIINLSVSSNTLDAAVQLFRIAHPHDFVGKINLGIDNHKW